MSSLLYGILNSLWEPLFACVNMINLCPQGSKTCSLNVHSCSLGGNLHFSKKSINFTVLHYFVCFFDMDRGLGKWYFLYFFSLPGRKALWLSPLVLLNAFVSCFKSLVSIILQGNYRYAAIFVS